jgi:hypothetical protein
MSPIKSHENRLEGHWLKVAHKVIADDTSHRIEKLISSELTKLVSSEDGWDVLYIDQRDGRKWELTYPHGEWHGGGPPMLTCVSDDYVRTKYKI